MLTQISSPLWQQQHLLYVRQKSIFKRNQRRHTTLLPRLPPPTPCTDRRFEVDARNANGDTPALLAAARGNADVLSLLVDKHGASLDAADAKGVGALHVACERRQSGVMSSIVLVHRAFSFCLCSSCDSWCSRSILASKRLWGRYT